MAGPESADDDVFDVDIDPDGPLVNRRKGKERTSR